MLVHNLCPTSTYKWQQGTNTAIYNELTCKVDCEHHQQDAYIDHLLPALMSTTPVSKQLTVADTLQDETSNQNGLLDVAMLSSPTYGR